MNGVLGMEKSGRRFPVDHLLLASIILLAGIGLVFLYSASEIPSERIAQKTGKDFSFISSQLFFAALSLPFFILATRIKLDVLMRKKWLFPLLLLLCAILCILPLFERFGGNKNGASRWISITLNLTKDKTISFQPSELVKLVMPMYLAYYFDKKREQLDQFFTGVLPPALVTVLFAGLVYLQNNFSTAMFIILNTIFIFFLAGVRLRYFAGALIVILPLGALMILTTSYRVSRIINWVTWKFTGVMDAQAGGYQPKNSMEAISSGGFWGKGLGQGVEKLSSIPEVQSDFIFAAYAEEAGFLGVLIFFLVLGLFAFRSYRTALGQEDFSQRLLVCGLTTTIVSQALLNVAVAAYILPTTGIPLPFFSSGGSSLLITLIMAGMLVNLSRTARYSFFRKKEESYVG